MKATLKISSILTALALTGCATQPDTQAIDITANNQQIELQNKLNRIQQKNQQLRSAVNRSKSDLQRLNNLNSQLKSSQSVATTGGGSMLPPNAQPGECYARVLTPATYRTETQDLLKTEASYKIKVSQPEYKMVKERVLVSEASEVAELIPARYEWQTERVLVKDAHEHLRTIPATFQTKSERILVKDAYTTWKKGRGPIEKLNNATGEIMCLVEIPAEYRTITSKVMITPARTESNTLPAEYKEVKKRVMVEGPTMVKRTIPAVYKTIDVRKIVTPAQESRIEIPAVYQSLTKRVKVSDSFLEWRSILCETNTTGDVVRSIQRALSTSGYNPGDIDGILGSRTLAAIKQYQQAKNLAAGQITIETLNSLGVRVRH